MALTAYIDAEEVAKDERATRRRKLQLEVEGKTRSGDGGRVLIHDLSQAGLLIETRTALSLGDPLEVELPQAGTRAASVVWARHPFFGCQFDEPLTTAAVSAALLRSPVARAPAADGEPDHRLSLRSRAGIILMLGAASWTLVIGAALLALG